MRATCSPDRRRFFALPAVALIGIYGALMLFAAACPADPAPPGSGHRHHHTTHDKAAHTILCVWACQISSPSTVIALQHAPQPVMCLIGALLWSSVCHRFPSRAAVKARPPPSLFRL